MAQDTAKIRYFLYARKSSEADDRQVASLDSQIDELTKLAKREGLEIIDILSEAQSAKAPNRPVFNAMLQRIHKGDAQGIICWKLDRLARNSIDGGQIMWMLQQGIIKRIQTYERSYYPTDNVLMMAVEFGMANQFIRDLSQNTKRGLRAKAERGWYPTYATLGYMHNPNKRKGEKEITKDPERFDLVRKLFDLMLTGRYTPPKILRIATDEWGLKNRANKKVTRSTIYRIFNDPFYYGAFEYPKESGNWHQGKHESMITAEEYDRIQAILGEKGKPRPHTHTFPFTGLMRCGECGATITAEEKIKRQKNGNIHRYTYYHCTKRVNPNCSQKTIRQEELEKQITNILERIEIPPEFCEWVLEELKSESKKETEDRDKILANLQRQYNACIKKIDTLIDMRTSGDITEDEFKLKKVKFVDEKNHLQELLNDTDRRVNKWIEKAEEVFHYAESASRRFKNGSLEAKREILEALGSNLSLKDRILSISVAEPLNLIEKVSPKVKAISKRLEPLKAPLTTTQTNAYKDLYSKSSMLLPG